MLRGKGKEILMRKTDQRMFRDASQGASERARKRAQHPRAATGGPSKEMTKRLGTVSEPPPLGPISLGLGIPFYYTVHLGPKSGSGNDEGRQLGGRSEFDSGSR